MRDVISGVNMENCEHPCVGEPCQNGGECLPKEDTYMCLCPLGFKGHSCHRGELNFGSSCSKNCVEKKVVLKSSFECKKVLCALVYNRIKNLFAFTPINAVISLTQFRTSKQLRLIEEYCAFITE